VSPSIREALARGAERLHAAGVESARLDARALLSFVLGIASDGLFCVDEIDESQIGNFGSLLERRMRREPLAYITGEKEFWSMNLEVGPGVLIPRPETETLLDEAFRAFPDTGASLRVLDIGTGSGCLLLAHLRERPNATGLGIDTSENALACARRNAARHGLAARCRFEFRDMSDRCDAPRRADAKSSLGLRAAAGRFDVILANPPYLTDTEFESSPPEIRNYEPRQALAAGADGLDAFRALAPVLRDSMTDSGLAFVEIGAGQAEKVRGIIIQAALELRRVASDLSGIPRCLVIGQAGQAAVGRL